MTTAIQGSRVKVAKVNRIVLNRGADLFFEGDHVFVPFGNHAAKDLPCVMEALGADEVLVSFHTISDPKARARDVAKYTRRLAGLACYAASGWAPLVIRGFVQADVMACTLSRKGIHDEG